MMTVAGLMTSGITLLLLILTLITASTSSTKSVVAIITTSTTTTESSNRDIVDDRTRDSGDVGECRVLVDDEDDDRSCKTSNSVTIVNDVDSNDIIFNKNDDRDDDDDDCFDEYDTDECSYWASLNPSECKMNPSYMLRYCKKSCNACGDKSTETKEDHEVDDLGIIQRVHFQVVDEEGTHHVTSPTAITTQQLQEHIQDARDYMARIRQEESLDEEVLDMCKLNHEHCALWSLEGECEKNTRYMNMECAPVCQTCHYLTVEGRCPVDPDAPVAWNANGDLDKMFRQLSSEPYLSKYDVSILSSPDIHEDLPWVITMEDVVSDTEADRLIELGALEGYERSTDVGDVKPDGTSESVTSSGRTSTNAWCQNECYDDPTAQAVIHRISNLTGIDETNSEYLQLLRYEVGQKYDRHHDYVPIEVNRQQGPRILTVYLYLNDVEAGGGTEFPDLDIICMPKRGRALIWPSVLDEDPLAIDSRTFHQALPVERGVKYGANAWFHLRDFKTPNRNHCQ